MLFALIGESCSAFSATSCKDFSAVGVRHSLSEAVLHLTLSLFRLICSFHPYRTSVLFRVVSALLFDPAKTPNRPLISGRRAKSPISTLTLYILLYTQQGFFVKGFFDFYQKNSDKSALRTLSRSALTVFCSSSSDPKRFSSRIKRRKSTRSGLP